MRCSCVPVRAARLCSGLLAIDGNCICNAVASAAERDEWLARLRACLPSDGGGGEPGAAEEPPGQESQVDNLLDFAEFRHLLESDEELRAQLPGDWRARCRQICKLRRAFLSADLDGDQVRACGSACVHAQVN